MRSEVVPKAGRSFVLFYMCLYLPLQKVFHKSRNKFSKERIIQWFCSQKSIFTNIRKIEQLIFTGFLMYRLASFKTQEMSCFKSFILLRNALHIKLLMGALSLSIRHSIWFMFVLHLENDTASIFKRTSKKVYCYSFSRIITFKRQQK